jgi:UDP-N-acetylmuramoyl-tripeptide--D-alanyl-D-alanine ligase
MRLDISTQGGVVLIDDAYNANLLSMTAALEVLVAAAGDGRRAAILGDMRELGPLEAESHRELGVRVAAAGLDLLICFGEAISETATAAAAAGMDPGRMRFAKTHDEAADMALGWLAPGDALLVKGSRGLTMELIVDRIRQGWQG